MDFVRPQASNGRIICYELRSRITLLSASQAGVKHDLAILVEGTSIIL